MFAPGSGMATHRRKVIFTAAMPIGRRDIRGCWSERKAGGACRRETHNAARFRPLRGRIGGPCGLLPTVEYPIRSKAP